MSTEHVDVAIIGGGAVGASIAYKLSLRDAHAKIAIFDPGNLKPATEASGAMIGAFSEITSFDMESGLGRTRFDLLLDSLQAWPSWLKRIESHAEHARPIERVQGTTLILNTVGGILDSNNFSAILSELRKRDEPFEELDPRLIPGLNPGVSERPLRAIYIPREFSIRSIDLTKSLNDIISQTVNIKRKSTSIKSIAKAVNGDYILNASPGQIVTTKKIVIAAGAYSQRLLDNSNDLPPGAPLMFASAGTALSFSPEWTYGIGRAKLPSTTIRTPPRSFGCGLHLIPFRESFYVGATNYITPKPWSFTNAGDVNFLTKCVTEQINKDISWCAMTDTHVGNRCTTLDGFPLVGRLGEENIWLATGLGRIGLTLSPLIADFISNEICNGTDQKSKFSQFNPKRELAVTHKKSAIKDNLKNNYFAAMTEHKNLSTSMIGLDLQMEKWIEAKFESILDELEHKFVPPAEIYPLIEFDPNNSLSLIRKNIAQTQEMKGSFPSFAGAEA